MVSALGPQIAESTVLWHVDLCQIAHDRWLVTWVVLNSEIIATGAYLSCIVANGRNPAQLSPGSSRRQLIYEGLPIEAT
jgi:hypothetical protein